MLKYDWQLKQKQSLPDMLLVENGDHREWTYWGGGMTSLVTSLQYIQVRKDWVETMEVEHIFTSRFFLFLVKQSTAGRFRGQSTPTKRPFNLYGWISSKRIQLFYQWSIILPHASTRLKQCIYIYSITYLHTHHSIYIDHAAMHS